jgi:hypothetical protein
MQLVSSPWLGVWDLSSLREVRVLSDSFGLFADPHTDFAVERAALVIDGNWGWRMPYAVQWVWPVPLLVAAYFAPESESVDFTPWGGS